MQVGTPADLIQSAERTSVAKIQLPMRMSDLVVATGGASMVKAAHSSGTQAYGVGVGNAASHLIRAQATLYQGAGHTRGIHSRRDDHVMALATGTKTARVMANQNLREGAGSF